LIEARRATISTVKATTPIFEFSRSSTYAVL